MMDAKGLEVSVVTALAGIAIAVGGIFQAFSRKS